jgi:hypothetical protein
MSLFAHIMKAGGKGQPESVAPAAVPVDLRQRDMIPDSEELRVPETARLRTGRRTGRTQVYAVRVREDFKGEMLGSQAELQLERQKLAGRARKVTEGELLELMLAAYKAARRNGDAIGYAVPIANDVWLAVHEIARRLQCSPEEVVEQLVVQKIDELGLLPRK